MKGPLQASLQFFQVVRRGSRGRRFGKVTLQKGRIYRRTGKLLFLHQTKQIQKNNLAVPPGSF